MILKGQIALITGASSGIGRAVAEAMGREGALVAVHYRNNRDGAEQAVEAIRLSGSESIAVRADVTVGADIGVMVDAVRRQWGRLDILVNNAGMFAPAPFTDMTDEQWDEMLNTNLKSQFLCAQAAARMMKTQGRGRIVNISSIGGLLAWPKYTHYCVSKAGVIMLTRCLARALAPEITVNSVAPGTIQFPGELPDEDYIRRAPLKKTGKGDDIAEAVLFLAQSDFITGQVLVVDGGRTLV